MTEQIECSTCKGKGTVSAPGFLMVVDWPCPNCRGVGKVDNPQLLQQQPPAHKP